MFVCYVGIDRCVFAHELIAIYLTEGRVKQIEVPLAGDMIKDLPVICQKRLIIQHAILFFIQGLKMEKDLLIISNPYLQELLCMAVQEAARDPFHFVPFPSLTGKSFAGIEIPDLFVFEHPLDEGMNAEPVIAVDYYIFGLGGQLSVDGQEKAGPGIFPTPLAAELAFIIQQTGYDR